MGISKRDFKWRYEKGILDGDLKERI